MDYELALRIFEQAGLFHATPLLVGSYAAALNYPLGFATTIPRRLKLPPLADNPAEGVVIKPLQTSSIPTPRGEIRPILTVFAGPEEHPVAVAGLLEILPQQRHQLRVVQQHVRRQLLLPSMVMNTCIACSLAVPGHPPARRSKRLPHSTPQPQACSPCTGMVALAHGKRIEEHVPLSLLISAYLYPCSQI